ncbi:Peroxisomal (S)-2-hydroxy-acid oxidase GLO5 [Holothuria leucospilota]|uniref:Peroxisomal (S)-2-hydroxy-acid oxidase GLO5 n=1 Tax=Holothuria leucospilota TaxID=206669 RepID=A0A9Q1BIR6_HOLLE|nr:Peroxisomal (S)-2-hydroxy-acid oxidase GLO5 [Holothuria leucospilota]
MPTPGVTRVVDFERLILGKIPSFLFDYYSTGAGDEHTLEETKKAFQRIHLRPRILRSIANVDISTKLQGRSVSFPLGIAPIGLQAIAHPDGHKATARAAENANVIMILTSWSFMTLEDVASSAPNALLWMQIYPFKDRSNTADMVRRAERSGYKAIVVTVDSPRCGPFKRRFRDRMQIAEQAAKYNIQG